MAMVLAQKISGARETHRKHSEAPKLSINVVKVSVDFRYAKIEENNTEISRDLYPHRQASREQPTSGSRLECHRHDFRQDYVQI